MKKMKQKQEKFHHQILVISLYLYFSCCILIAIYVFNGQYNWITTCLKVTHPPGSQVIQVFKPLFKCTTCSFSGARIGILQQKKIAQVSETAMWVQKLEL